MRKILLIGAATLGLAGCTALSEIEGASISPQAASVAIGSFNTLETVATGYLQLPLCGASAPATCRTQAGSTAIASAFRTGRTARNQVFAALSSSSGAAIPVASYNTLTAMIATLQSAYAQYNVPVPAN
jgi:hypothetical protein